MFDEVLNINVMVNKHGKSVNTKKLHYETTVGQTDWLTEKNWQLIQTPGVGECSWCTPPPHTLSHVGSFKWSILLSTLPVFMLGESYLYQIGIELNFLLIKITTRFTTWFSWWIMLPLELHDILGCGWESFGSLYSLYFTLRYFI